MPIVPIEAIQPAVQTQQIVQLQATDATASVADPAAVAKFQAAMAASEVQAPAAPVQASAPVETPFLGHLDEAFLNAETQNRQMVQRMESLIASSGSNGGMSPVDVMALQYQVANLTFQQEVVSKVVDKVSTAIQTLVKNQ